MVDQNGLNNVFAIQNCEDSQVKLTHSVVLIAALMIASASAGIADEPAGADKWPAARVLVWATPGTSGVAWNLSSWTQYASIADYRAGKAGGPATSLPDKDTDIVLPTGEAYVVGYIFMPRKREGGFDAPQLTCRHVTVGKGAGLDGGAQSGRGQMSYSRGPIWDTGLAIHGNVQVADGGYIYGPHVFCGDRDTTFEIGDSPEPLGTSWVVRKADGARVTLLAKDYELARGVAVESGRLVLGTGCTLRFGAGYDARVDIKKLQRVGEILKEAYVYVSKGAAMELRPGSRIGRASAPTNTIADFRIEGLLHVSGPDGKNSEPATIELTVADGPGGYLTQSGGLYIRPAAEVRNEGKLTITAPAGTAKAADAKGVSVFLERTVDLGNVYLDGLRRGGFAATNATIAKAATAGATFGPNCAATGEALLSTFDVIDFAGGDGTIEFVDGLKTKCRILFPNAGRLIVRGIGNRTLQSFDLASVHTVTVNGNRTEFNAKRPLDAKEKDLRTRNALWGDVPGKGQLGRYGGQQWPDSPVMIWARPGESGSRFTGPNWLNETGQPYFEVPLISQRMIRSDNAPLDILMPAAKTPYFATGWGAGGNEGGPPVRHLTVEQNASYGITYNVQGNLWMKHGSGLIGKHRGRYDTIQPNVHRFLRFDGDRMGREGTLMPSENATLSQWGNFTAGKGSTIELIGRIRAAADRMYICGEGMLIISEGSWLADGPRAAIAIAPTATLALLQDAHAGHRAHMQRGGCAAISVAGTLLIGLPERPIRKDMVFPICGIKKDQLTGVAGGGGMRGGGASLIVASGGRFTIHSADPTKARVIFQQYDPEQTVARSRSYGPSDGLAFYIAGNAALNGVVFDNVLEGGIMAPAAMRKTWKNVSYGKNNLAAPEKLHWDMTGSNGK